MKHEHYKADLSDWSLKAIDEVVEQVHLSVKKAAAEALQYVFENDETYVFFPVEWSKDVNDNEGSDGCCGTEVADPLTVYLRVGMESAGEKPVFSFNLRDELNDTIEHCREDGSFAAGLTRLSLSLRELADDIDAAICISNA